MSFHRPGRLLGVSPKRRDAFVRTVRALALATVCGAMLVPSIQAQPGVDLIIDDVGWGTRQVDPGLCEPSVEDAQAKAFRGPIGTLCIYRSLPLSDIEVALFVDLSRDPSALEFPLGVAQPAVAHASELDTDVPVYVAAFGAGELVYTFLFIRSSAPPPGFDAQEFVRELAALHVELVMPTPPPPPEPPDPELVRLLGDLDGFAKVSAPLANPHLAGEFELQGEAGIALSRDTESALQFYQHRSSGLLVGAMVVRYPYSLFAAAALGDSAGLDSTDRLPSDVPGSRPGIIEYPDSLDGGESVTFRQGRYQYIVTAPAATAQEQALVDRVTVAAAAGLYDIGPGGATDAFFFPTTFEAVWKTGALILVGLVAIVALRALFGPRARRIRRSSDVPGLVDVEPDAARLRRNSRLLLAIQALGISGVIATLSLGTDALELAVSAAFALCAVLAGPIVRRIERPKAIRIGWRRPPVRGVLVGAVALVALGAGGVALVRGASTWLFTPRLSHLELSSVVGVEPLLLSQTMVIGGAVALVAGSAAYRRARTRVRATVNQRQERDDRGETLYLRSFADDDLPIPTTSTTRRPFLESFSLLGAEPFELSIAWQLDQLGPVVAVNRPGRPLASLGAARENLAEWDWQIGVIERLDRSRVVVIVIGRSEGIGWELQQTIGRGHVHKTLFLCPPVSEDELHARWEWSRHAALQVGGTLSDQIDPAECLAIVQLVDGTTVGVTASRRDEASYRAAVDRALSLAGLG